MDLVCVVIFVYNFLEEGIYVVGGSAICGSWVGVGLMGEKECGEFVPC